MTTQERAPQIPPGSDPAAVFIDSYLRRRRQAEEAFKRLAAQEESNAKRYGRASKVEPEELPKRLTPLFTELVGDRHERELHRSLFVGAILLGSARRQEKIALAAPLSARDIRRYDDLAALIEIGQPTPNFAVGEPDLQYARELVENLEDKNHAAESIAIAAHTAIQAAFSQQANPVA